MDTSGYDETIYAMRDVIFRDYPFAIVKQRLLQLCVGEQNIAFIDTICSELGAVCLQPLSKVVNRATMIIAELATQTGPEITMRMCQKDFQDYLMYTLRRLTTKLGNLLTMHPQIWAEIETRVLNLYAFWNQKLGDQDGKYFHALERYRMLRQTVAFPSYNPYIQMIINKPTQLKSSVNLQMLKDVKQLLDWCNQKISEGNSLEIMNTACVRNIKSRSQQLHKIWTTQTLVGQDKQKIKDYYSQLRKMAKFIDSQNQNKKKQQQKNYLDSKKNKIQTGGTAQPTKIISPIKSKNSVDNNSNDLLSQQIPSPKKPQYINLVQTSLIDTNDVNVLQKPQKILKPLDYKNQLMEVFSSQDQISSTKQLQSPTKQDNQFDQFNMFTTAIPSQEQIPAVTLLSEDIESPLQKKKIKQPEQKIEKEEDLINLI